MLKSEALVEYNGKTYKKIFTSGQIIKCEQRGNRTIMTLSHYKGKGAQNEFTNNIYIDDKKVGIIKSLKKGTQIFCELNVQVVEKDGKTYTNLYLFNFEIGKEGTGEPFNGGTSTPAGVQDFEEDAMP